MDIRNFNQNSREKETSTKQRLVGKVLSPAVKLFLRSQVEKVSHLEVKISGGDRQLLSGSIGHVAISASQAVYQGLHLSQLQLAAQGIRTNLGQVIKGQPLRLLETVPVFGELILQESDLNASLQAPLLSNALTDLLKTLFPESYLVKQQSKWHKIAIATNQLIIHATVVDEHNRLIPIIIRSGVELASCREIRLTQPQILAQTNLPGVEVDSFKFDLGPEVAIEELFLDAGKLICRGRINVVPA